MGDHAEAKALACLRDVLGIKHPNATSAAWNLFLTVTDTGDQAVAQTILDQNLLWLLDNKVPIHDTQQK